ncbi:MAG: DUF1573 domain-containing protein [Planctomycetota bacterium]
MTRHPEKRIMFNTMFNRLLSARLLGAAILVALFAGTILAKPPSGQENAKKTPPNIKAAQGTQPAGAKHIPQAPPVPQATVQLKPGEEPKIEFDTPVYDAGRIRSGKDIVHDFWFHNTGTGPAEIIQVKPSCGCTTSGEYDRIVPPGKSGKIPLKVATGHFSGPISKSVTIVTNQSGPASMVTLQIKGEMWQMVQAAPNSALFGNVSASSTKDATLTRKITITNNAESPLTLATPKCSTPAFSASLNPLEPGRKWELTVSLAKDLPNGAVTGNVEIETGLTELPKIQVACNAYLVSDVDVVPNKIAIPGTRTVPMQRDFYVRNNAAKPLVIADLAASNPKLKLNLQETQPGMAYRVTAEFPPDLELTKDGESITFSTNNPAYAKMTIPVAIATVPPAAVATNATPGAAQANQKTPVTMQPISTTPPTGK